jgi:hypothetical protein
MLVDNFISAFARQRDNGVPILPFYQSTEDCELQKLARFIKQQVVGQQDIRPLLRSTFHVSLYHETRDIRELVGLLQNGFKVGEKA